MVSIWWHCYLRNEGGGASPLSSPCTWHWYTYHGCGSHQTASFAYRVPCRQPSCQPFCCPQSTSVCLMTITCSIFLCFKAHLNSFMSLSSMHVLSILYRTYWGNTFLEFPPTPQFSKPVSVMITSHKPFELSPARSPSGYKAIFVQSGQC